MRVRRHQGSRLELRLRLPRRGVLLLLGVVGGAVLLGLVVAALWFVPGDALQGRIVVPAVVGVPLEEATRRLADAGLRPRSGETEPSPVTPAGAVTWQDPPGGLRVPAGAVVQLVQSSGPDQVPVPDVTGLDEALARQVVEAAGLRVEGVDSSAADVPRGVVVATRPSAGAARSAASSVMLMLSRGPADRTVPVLTGVPLGEARARLEAAGLRVGAVRPSSAAGSLVTGQRPRAGSRVAAGTAVDLNVRREP